MFKEKTKMKVVVGVFVLMGIFAGIFLIVNNIVLSLAAEGQNADESVIVLMEEEVTEEMSKEELWAEEDERLRERIRLKVLEEQRKREEDYILAAIEWGNENTLEWEWPPPIPLTEEEIEKEIEQRMLSTPRERHLSKEEATAIVAEWINEDFGIKVDLDLPSYSFFLRFEHEELGIVPRSFWAGSLDVFEIYGYTESGEMMMSGRPHAFVFSFDGITGERVSIQDQMQPFEPLMEEVIIENMKLKVFDFTERVYLWNPSFAVEHRPYYLSSREVAMLIAMRVYEEFQIKLDGHFINVFLTPRYLDGMSSRQINWRGSVEFGEEHCYQSNLRLFFFAIDAVTGEAVEAIMDAREMTGPGFNHPVPIYEEITLNNISFTIGYFLEGDMESAHLSIEDVGRITAEGIEQEFDVSLDGLFVSMRLNDMEVEGEVQPIWTVSILTEEQGEYWFLFWIHGVTGEWTFEEVIDLRGINAPI